MNKRKVIPMSERLQVICFLIWNAEIRSTLKVFFLTEIIYGAKGSINKLVNSRKSYDFCARLLKVSVFSLQNERSKKDITDILLMLENKGFVTIDGLNLEKQNTFTNIVNLNYLSDELVLKLRPFVDMTDESFLEEVIKYAKDY